MRLKSLRQLMFGQVAAGFCGFVAVMFLAINSGILARGAMRWAHSPWDQVSYGFIAATVPWVIALMPFLFAVTWKRGRWLSMPSLWTIVIGAVWVTFVAYNILGAGGAMNFTRSDVLAERQHDAARGKERARLATLRDAIPADTRPAALLAPLLKAEEGKREWQWSEACSEQRPATRKFCLAYAKLASELGAARELERLTAEIGTIDRNTPAGAVEVIDPSAQFWASWTGLRMETVQAVIPLATPIVLEIGSMVFLSFALLLAGFKGHQQMVLGGRPQVPQVLAPSAERREAVSVGPLVASPPALPPPSRDRVAAGRQLAEWFFSECTRPVASGGLPEERWYALYTEQCALSNDKPIPLADFRAIAQRRGVMIMIVNGQHFYQRVLPLVPREGAA